MVQGQQVNPIGITLSDIGNKLVTSLSDYSPRPMNYVLDFVINLLNNFRSYLQIVYFSISIVCRACCAENMEK